MTRYRVVEYRVAQLFQGLRLRFWIESDPEHGGKSRAEAEALIKDARERGYLVDWTAAPDITLKVATFFLEAVPCANAVEACDGADNGTVVYREWP